MLRGAVAKTCKTYPVSHAVGRKTRENCFSKVNGDSNRTMRSLEESAKRENTWALSWRDLARYTWFESSRDAKFNTTPSFTIHHRCVQISTELPSLGLNFIYLVKSDLHMFSRYERTHPFPHSQIAIHSSRGFVRSNLQFARELLPKLPENKRIIRVISRAEILALLLLLQLFNVCIFRMKDRCVFNTHELTTQPKSYL